MYEYLNRNIYRKYPYVAYSINLYHLIGSY